MSDLSPPWVLFTDGGKPVAILPAGRPGEVAKCGHLTLKEASKIVRLANQLSMAIRDVKMDYIERALVELAKDVEQFRVDTSEREPA